MMRSKAVAMMLGLAGIAAGATAWAAQDTASQKVQKMTAGRTPGEPIACVSKSPRTKIEILDSSAIAVFDSAKRYNISLIPSGCSFLKPNRQLVMDGTKPRFCEGDPFFVVDAESDVRYGSCRWGKFIPYDRPEK